MNEIADKKSVHKCVNYFNFVPDCRFFMPYRNWVKLQLCWLPCLTSEFTQQDGRKKRTANPLCVTNVTRLSLACFDMNFANINVFWSFTKKSV